MALKLPDSAVPMGDFPVAKAVDIDFNDGENLQEKLDNGKLGGGGSSSEKQIKDWVSGSSYLKGDYIYHEGEIYRCLTSNSDVDFDESNWEQLTTMDSEVVKKTDITTTIDRTSVDTQVPSAKTIYDEFIVDKIKDYYVNVNSSTALSKYGIDDITTLTGLLSLTSKLETNIRFTIQINDAVKQTLYDCGVIPVNVGGLLVISQQSRGKAVYTTDFCETYVNVTSNVKSTEWGKWEKLRTTTVGDIGVTTITSINSAITGVIEYTVKNGICYVSLFNIKSTNNENGLLISTTMPKSAINSSSAIFCQSGSDNIGFVCIDKNTTLLSANINIVGTTGCCSFSYPVAE